MSEVGQYVMDVASARKLTERIRLNVVSVRDGVEKLQTLLGEAKTGNVHVALGYPSWTAYIADVMGEEPLRLSRDDRREIVHYLTGEGMSTRAIGATLGVDQKTVVNDRRAGEEISSPRVDRSTSEVFDPEVDDMPGAEDDLFDDGPDETPAPEQPAAPAPEPRKITGLDGKAYTPPPPRAASEPKRRPLPDAFFDAVYDLGKKAETVRRLTEDDRFPQNAEKVAAKHRNDLIRTRDLIDQVLAQLQPKG